MDNTLLTELAKLRQPKRPRHNRFGMQLDEVSEPTVASDSYYMKTPNGDDIFDKYNHKKLKWGKSKYGFRQSKYAEEYLKKGTIIIRYGGEEGYYAAPVGTSFGELALPYLIESLEYNEYEVMVDDTVPVDIIGFSTSESNSEPMEPIDVYRGIVAKQRAWPSEPGGGTQYYFPHKDRKKHVLSYVGRGLRRLDVSEWSTVLDEDRKHI